MKKKQKNKYLKRLCLEFSKIIDKYQTSITRSSKTPNRLLKKKLTQNDFGWKSITEKILKEVREKETQKNLSQNYSRLLIKSMKVGSNGVKSLEWKKQKLSTVLYTVYAKAFDCVDHNKLWKILKDGNTRPPDLSLETFVCRSGSNS